MSHCRDIIPEDGAIRMLIRTLGFRNPNHAHGISDTLAKINNHFKNRFAIGIIDDDKRKPNLFDAYQNIIEEEHTLQLRQKPESQHYIIILYPPNRRLVD